MKALGVRKTMRFLSARGPLGPALVLGALLAAILACCGCEHLSGFLGFRERQREAARGFHAEPSAELLREIHPADSYLLLGRLVLNADPRGPLLVVAVTDRYRKREIVVSRTLQAPAEYYQAYLPEGTYDLYFFADLDGNGYFDAYEMIGQTSGEPIRVAKSEVKDGLTMNGPSFNLDLRGPARTDLPIRVKVREQAYAFASLDDEFFDPKYGPVGLYDPKALIAHTQRYFFSLGKFDPDKTMVVFVHGIGGTPRDFKYLVDGLDKTRYQPWFYFYPTGMPLQKMGALLADVLLLMGNTREYHPKGIIVVAHSMGGLVALAALNQICRDGPPPHLKGYISFNSPYGGVEAARMAGRMHVTVPSWIDIAAGSPFLERLYRGNALQNLPFYLFFGYKAGDGSDGTIGLQSQLEPKIHLQATQSYGFQANHEGILKDEGSRRVFIRALETAAAK
jgi:pimeloyl-ACP methyl ester carboxylesterase